MPWVEDSVSNTREQMTVSVAPLNIPRNGETAHLAELQGAYS